MKCNSPVHSVSIMNGFFFLLFFLFLALLHRLVALASTILYTYIYFFEQFLPLDFFFYYVKNFWYRYVVFVFHFALVLVFFFYFISVSLLLLLLSLSPSRSYALLFLANSTCISFRRSHFCTSDWPPVAIAPWILRFGLLY